ncbi:hypothetical protein RQP46_000074 [Phenoliferia psychrophenolica]
MSVPFPFPAQAQAEVDVDPVKVHDIAELPATPSADDLLQILRSRFDDGILFTEISPRVLVAVNPLQEGLSTNDDALRSWSEEFADTGTSGVRGRLGPHLWAVSGRTYYYMRRTGQDQTIVLSGETGSGKSESGRLLIKSLVDLSLPPPGKKGSKLASTIPAATFILDAFGSATTLTNSNASRFGRYTELQFSDTGRLVGAKGLEYYLEKSRVTGASAGERNFHVFYYLVTGASPEERQHLHLDDKTTFRYLAHHRLAPATSTVDANRFGLLKEAFKAIGFPKKVVASLCQILAAILHLGNVEFHMDKKRNVESAVVKNTPVLEVVAEFLGVDSVELEHALTNKVAQIDGELCSAFLDPEGASANRDDLARALYGLVFSWIGEFLNQKLCRDDFATFIALVDFPGPVQSPASSHRDASGLDAFCFNLASERVHAFYLDQLFEANKAEYAAEGVDRALLEGLATSYHSNAECVRVLTNVPGGLVHIIDDQSHRRGKTDATMLAAMTKRWGSNPSFGSREGDAQLGRPGTFLCAHWDGQVNYSVENFLSDNSSAVPLQFVNLLGGSTPSVGQGGRTSPGARDQLSTGGSSLSFVRQLFAADAIETLAHPRSEATIVGANQKVGPRRAPSTSRRGGRTPTITKPEDSIDETAAPPEENVSKTRSVVTEFNNSLTVLLSTIKETKSWHVVCLRPNDAQLPNQLDARLLRQQIRAFALPELAQRLRGEWAANLEQAEWWDRYQRIAPLEASASVLAALTYRDKANKVREMFGWKELDMIVGKTKVFLSDFAFRKLEDFLRADEPEERQRNQERAQLAAVPHQPDPYSPYSTYVPASFPSPSAHTSNRKSTAALPLIGAGGSPYDDGDSKSPFFYDETDPFGETDLSMHRFRDEESQSGYAQSQSGYAPSRPMFDPLAPLAADSRDDKAKETVEEVGESAARKRWVFLTWAATWWIPSFTLRWCGGMKRKDVRMAWREKVLINMLIWFVMGCAVFVVSIMGLLICPTEHIFGTNELSARSYTADQNNMLVAIRGEAFDLSSFAKYHEPGSAVIPLKTIEKYGGTDATDIFPVQVSALCNGITGAVSPWVTLSSSNTSSTVANVAKYHDFRAYQDDYRPDWYFETMIYLRYNYRKGFMGYSHKVVKTKASSGNVIAIYKGGIYDLTTYVTNSGQVLPASFRDSVHPLFQRRSGHDITNELNNLGLDADVLARQLVCLRNLFFIGKVDNRNSAQCLFSEYILLALSCVMLAVISFKFLSALQFGKRRQPENYDKFVICQVPCYTEGEASLRNCIDSLAKLNYDDKRKLLFLICDGMIVGAGNDKPTPRIVLDILGADPTIDPEPLSFLSIGEGKKQHNMAKIYSGLHEAGGHIVPYIVVVKVGNPSERSRPGNRGKRDSQMLLMRFLNRVHFDAPMTPAELEMYHQIKNVIGVNPSFYEYLLMVDADTVVEQHGLNYVVGAFVQDRKLLGSCGETSISNAKASLTTMMQVYEYWISQFLTKTFESLFNSVTCLPGCFSMYRIRSLEHRPLLISNAIIREYGTTRTNTLHVKNLLTLGEDRYLTTCMLKEFPELKMKVCLDAKAYTIAPDDWKVLMSQRRRWINSTIHNFAELLMVDKLCGFCCFSMRFVVLLDLTSTIIGPVTVGYIVYLIYDCAAKGETIPTWTLIMICAIYGFQVVIYILHMKFEHIGWMFMYILAIPFFSFVLPIVSFWQMDDFSWGSTREIVGEKGKRILIHEEGEFDPATIPLKSWETFENELWEQGSNQSIGEIQANLREERGDSRYGASQYGEVPSTRSELGKQQSPLRSPGLTPPEYPRQRSARLSLAVRDPFGDSNPTSPVNSSPDRNPRESGTSSGYFAGGVAEHRLTATSLALNDFGARPLSAMPTPLGVQLGYIPAEEVIVADVRAILAASDLSVLTKAGVRKDLEVIYGVHLDGQTKAFVNRQIEQALGLP